MQTSETGRIFDVRRFSTHDGGGIRTTVFLKGCPLRCMWCHNPEGINSGRRPVWFPGKCIGCGSCADAAKHGGALVSEGRVLVNPDAPEDWDGLMDSCPTGALRWDSRDISADALMEEILRDMYQSKDATESLKTRLVSYLDTPWSEDGFLLSKLCRIVRMIYSANHQVRPDFRKLADDLTHWNDADRHVQRRWIRTICRAIETENKKTEDE